MKKRIVMALAITGALVFMAAAPQNADAGGCRRHHRYHHHRRSHVSFYAPAPVYRSYYSPNFRGYRGYGYRSRAHFSFGW